jgi:C-1 hydroxylase
MSTEENKAIVRRWLEVWNTGDLEPLKDLIAPDYVMHFSSRTVRPESGPEWYAQYVREVLAVYPDFHVTAEDLLADGDKVIGRLAWTGTKLGESKTRWGALVPASGVKVAGTTFTIARLAGGRIAEEWWLIDVLTELQQLGVLPATVPSGA